MSNILDINAYITNTKIATPSRIDVMHLFLALNQGCPRGSDIAGHRGGSKNVSQRPKPRGDVFLYTFRTMLPSFPQRPSEHTPRRRYIGM